MKDKLGKKLNSNSGVSILIALLLFLVATMVAVVIISAALTAVKDVAGDKGQNQNYLNVNSSAKLVGQMLKDSECTVITSVTQTGEDGEGNQTYTTEMTYIPGEGPLDKVITALVKRADTVSGPQSCTIRIKPQSHSDKLNDCEVELNMMYVDPKNYSGDDLSDCYKIEAEVREIGSDGEKGQLAYVTASIGALNYSDNGKRLDLKWNNVKLSTKK